MGIETKACKIELSNIMGEERRYCVTHASFYVFDTVDICDDGAFFLLQRVGELLKEVKELRQRVNELENESNIDDCNGDCAACRDNDATHSIYLDCKVFPDD